MKQFTIIIFTFYPSLYKINTIMKNLKM